MTEDEQRTSADERSLTDIHKEVANLKRKSIVIRGLEYFLPLAIVIGLCYWLVIYAIGDSWDSLWNSQSISDFVYSISGLLFGVGCTFILGIITLNLLGGGLFHDRSPPYESEIKMLCEEEQKVREKPRKVREQRERKVREQREREVREQRAREVREQREREVREQREREVREQRERKVREQRESEVREQRAREVREQRAREVREQRAREVREQREREAEELKLLEEIIQDVGARNLWTRYRDATMKPRGGRKRLEDVTGPSSATREQQLKAARWYRDNRVK